MPNMSQMIMEGGLASRIARITPMFFSVTTTCLVEVNEDIINVSHCRLVGVPDKLKLLSEVLAYIIILFGMFLTCALSIVTIICVCVLYQRLCHGKNSRISGDDKLPEYAGIYALHSIGLVDHELFDNHTGTDAEFARPKLAQESEKWG